MGGDIGDDPRDGSRSSAVQMESSAYDRLMKDIEGAGIFWPNPAPAPNSGQHTSQTPDTVDGLVLSVFPYTAILSNCFRSWDWVLRQLLESDIRRPPTQT